MTQVTTNLALTKPGGGSTGLNMPPDRVDVDIFNDNFDKIDSAVGNPAQQNRQFTRPASELINVSGMKRGDRFVAADTGREWVFNGTNWVDGATGMIKVVPGSVTGLAQATVDGSGSVVVSATSGSGRINIDNVFDFSKYKRYRIVHQVRKSGVTTTRSGFFRNGTPADITAAGTYYNTQIASTGNSAPAYVQNVAAGITSILDGSGSAVFETLDFFMAADGSVAIIEGTGVARVGNYEQKFVTVSYEGAGANGIRGIGIDYGQAISSAEWSFYAYA